MIWQKSNNQVALFCLKFPVKQGKVMSQFTTLIYYGSYWENNSKMFDDAGDWSYYLKLVYKK